MSYLFGCFEYSETQRELFKAGILWKRWIRDYPDLFDKDDERLVESQAAYNYHFYEWLAAVLLYNLTGYLSLVEKYQFQNHLVKRNKLEKLLPGELLKTVYDSKRRGAQFPDILAYRDDYSDWFFCEVKGPNDFIRKGQVDLFGQIERLTRKEVRIIRFKASH